MNMKMTRIDFARFIGYLEHTHSLNLSVHSIRDIDDIINIDVPEPDPSPPVLPAIVSGDDIEALLIALRRDDKIPAIKALRKVTHLGLLEAKNMVERYSGSPGYEKF